MHTQLPDPALSAYALTPPVSTFALTETGINNRTTGIRSGEGAFIWKTYQTHSDPQAIHYEHRLLAWLDGRDLGFAVPAPIRTQEGATLVASDEGWKALFALIPGAPPDRGKIKHFAAMGAALGALHRALVDYPLATRPHVHGYGDLRHVHPAIPDPWALTPGDLGLSATQDLSSLLARWHEDLAELDEFTRSVYVHLPRQMTHGDYAPGNTLIQEDRLTAILDFDLSQPDARAIDIASGLKFSLRIWERSNPLEFGAAFWQGYRRWVQPSEDEIAAIPAVMRLRDAVSAIWWLGRGLASGTVDAGIARLRDQQETKVWLTQHSVWLDEMMG